MKLLTDDFFIVFFSFLLTFSLDLAPSAPINFRQLKVRDSRVEIEWQRPTQTNGIIHEYRIYVLDTATNKTDVQKVKPVPTDQSSFKYIIENLRKYICFCCFNPFIFNTQYVSIITITSSIYYAFS